MALFPPAACSITPAILVNMDSFLGGMMMADAVELRTKLGRGMNGGEGK
jgi:hypothetical protein